MIICQNQTQDYLTSFTDGQHLAQADASPEHGGQGQGFRPHDLLEAALGSCINIVLRVYAQKHGIPLEGLKVEVNLNRDNPDEARFEYSMELQGQLLDEEQRAKLMKVAKACPVHKTLSRKISFLAK